MRIHLVICYHCDSVKEGGLVHFFDKEGMAAMSLESKAKILDCLKCGGIKSKFMFTIDYVGNETHE